MTQHILCFSHLRWNFVYQRPQQILGRLAISHRVYYFEEPVFDAETVPYHHIYVDQATGVRVIIPHLNAGISEEEALEQQRMILDSMLNFQGIKQYILWYYSPMAYAFSAHLQPSYVVYDCMDELSAFMNAPPALKLNEYALIERADIVFTGGNSLYRAKKQLHPNIYCFPSSIDKAHFHHARKPSGRPSDQDKIPGPRIGFFGVIDERLNISLLDEVAEKKPDWHLILVGPIVKIDPAILPKRPNIHYLGPKEYADLPRYLGGWDIAMIPFALNASTKFISPTKTPEYLAGGKPVISPSIADVIVPYGELGLVRIADTPDQFIAAAEDLLENGSPASWLSQVDAFLAGISWDNTVERMLSLIDQGIQAQPFFSQQNSRSHV